MTERSKDDTRRHSATNQPMPQPLPPARKAAAHGSHRQSEPVRRFFVRQPFEVAGNDRSTIRRGNPIQLLMKHRADLGTLDVVIACDFLFRSRNRPQFNLAPIRVGFGTQRHPKRNAVQPPAQRVMVPDPARPAHQNQKGRLKRVFDVMRLAQDPPADLQHHRSVPSHQLRESRLGLRLMRLERL